MGNRASAGLVYGTVFDNADWNEVEETNHLAFEGIGEEFGPSGTGYIVFIEETARLVGLLEGERDLVIEDLPEPSPEALSELKSYIEERGGESPKWRLFYAYR